MDASRLIPQKIYSRFTQRAKHALEEMQRIAIAYPSWHTVGEEESCFFIEPEHLLLAIFQEQGSMARNILETHRIRETDILELLSVLIPTSAPQSDLPSTPALPRLSPTLSRILKKAVAEASANGQAYIGTEHLLFAILASRKDFFSSYKTRGLRSHLEEILANVTPLSSLEKHPSLNVLEMLLRDSARTDPPSGMEPSRQTRHDDELHTHTKIKRTKTPTAIDYFCQDLTVKAEAQQLDPVISRERELERLIAILLRRTKNNPLLIGEAGVGKTALIHLLSQKIARGEVPEPLMGRRVVSLDLGLLVSGTVFRGEFESRLKELMRDVADTNAILFIDEIHTIIGTGSAQGSLDAANILKPILASGEIQCIGATTFAEYRTTIERDRALERRFQPLLIEELSSEATIRVLGALQPFFETHYHMQIPDALMAEIVHLAVTYAPGRFLPDKAIDILDEACAQYAASCAPQSALTKDLHRLAERKKHIQKEKEVCVTEERYEDALKLREEEAEIEREVERIGRIRKEHRLPPLILTKEMVRRFVSETTGVPIEEIDRTEAKRLRDLKRSLGAKIFGQDHAIAAIAKMLRRGRMGLGDPRRPWGSFLFLGPTGVGKTEMARVLAGYLSQHSASPTKDGEHPKNFVRLDMSEFSEPHSIAKIIGAPPGYVGYEDETILPELVRRHPFSVVLFDEIEKAHPQIFNILLQILEEGELTKSNGVRVSFKNAIIILTSNIGTEEFTKTAGGIGFSEKQKQKTGKGEDAIFLDMKERALAELKKILRPEILSRIDHVIVFHALEKRDIEKVVTLQLEYLKNRMQRCTLAYSRELVDAITEKSFDPREGARRVRKVIEEMVESVVTDFILRHMPPPGTTLFVTARNEKIVVESPAKSVNPVRNGVSNGVKKRTQ